ncbi:GrpB family protein [Bacillus carboniphilus]
MDKEITIESYNLNWIKQFEEEKVKLKGMLGEKIQSIEHIGSTSVQGLGSKPIIDIAIGVEDLENVTEFIEPLKQLGYEYVLKEDFPERRFFRKGQWRAGTHHLHFYRFEGEHWNNQILFRDYLRENPDASKEYYQLKVNLAMKFRFDRVSYTQNKASFIQSVLRKAKKEEKSVKTKDNGLRFLEFLSISEEDIYTYDPLAGSFAVIKCHGDYLMCYNTWRKQWELPAGRREENETPKECAIRELYEETGQYVTHVAFKGLMKSVRTLNGEIRLNPIYFAEVSELQPFIENDETSKIKLWNLKDDIGVVDSVDIKIFDFI